MNEMMSAVSAASTTRRVMYVNTLNVRTYFSSSWASSSSMVAPGLGCFPDRLRERVGQTLHAHEPRALHEQRRARLDLALRRGEDRLEAVEVARARAEGACRGGALRPQG